MTDEIKDLNAYMAKMFIEMDKAFNKMEAAMDEMLKREAKWEAHRSWIPRKVGKRWYMPGRLLYRKFVWHESRGHYEYGTEFDVLKDSK
jgi:hypothetical protein